MFFAPKLQSVPVRSLNRQPEFAPSGAKMIVSFRPACLPVVGVHRTSLFHLVNRRERRSIVADSEPTFVCSPKPCC